MMPPRGPQTMFSFLLSWQRNLRYAIVVMQLSSCIRRHATVVMQSWLPPSLPTTGSKGSHHRVPPATTKAQRRHAGILVYNIGSHQPRRRPNGGGAGGGGETILSNTCWYLVKPFWYLLKPVLCIVLPKCLYFVVVFVLVAILRLRSIVVVDVLLWLLWWWWFY